MTAASGTDSEAPGHEHRDVSGGWLRPAVFGAMDGLVTNVSLIAGVGGGGGSRQFIVLTGLAGLAAGPVSVGPRGVVLGSPPHTLNRGRGRKRAHQLQNKPRTQPPALCATLR